MPLLVVVDGRMKWKLNIDCTKVEELLSSIVAEIKKKRQDDNDPRSPPACLKLLREEKVDRKLIQAPLLERLNTFFNSTVTPDSANVHSNRISLNYQ